MRKHCPNCNAELAGSGWICPACGWGNKDGAEGVDIGSGFKISAGQTVRSTPLKLPPGNDPYGLEETDHDRKV